MTNFPVYKRAQLYCDNHREMNCGVCAESYLVEGIRIADRRIAELQQRLAAAEAKNTELEKELFVLSSDVIYCGCGHVTAGLQEKAKRIYGKLRESGGEG